MRDNNDSSAPANGAVSGENRYTLGILGGLGPFASAEFLRTIYEYGYGQREQLLPRVVLYSDPTFPDRTETLLGGSHAELLERFVDALHKLCGLGVSNVVVCCVTIHYLLSELPSELREKIISLVDIIFAETIQKRQRQLLFCTHGSRKLGIFRSHRHWERAEEFIVLPDEADQQTIHAMIYKMKSGQDIDSHVPVLDALLSKYEVDSFIAGCTEMHLLSKRVALRDRYDCIDPLISVARSLSVAAEQATNVALR
jgi:aspartate racemase